MKQQEPSFSGSRHQQFLEQTDLEKWNRFEAGEYFLWVWGCPAKTKRGVMRKEPECCWLLAVLSEFGLKFLWGLSECKVFVKLAWVRDSPVSFCLLVFCCLEFIFPLLEQSNHETLEVAFRSAISAWLEGGGEVKITFCFWSVLPVDYHPLALLWGNWDVVQCNLNIEVNTFLFFFSEQWHSFAFYTPGAQGFSPSCIMLQCSVM